MQFRRSFQASIIYIFVCLLVILLISPYALGINRYKIDERRLANSDSERIEVLKSIGYLPGYEQPPGFSGVTVYDEDKVYDGFNFYVSGHGYEVYLIHMNGSVAHTWNFDPNILDYKITPNSYWRRGHLLGGGDILLISEANMMVRIDKYSNLVWESQMKQHHDISVADGKIYTLAYVERNDQEIMSRYKYQNLSVEYDYVLDNYLLEMDMNGVILSNLSVYDLLSKSKFNYTIKEEIKKPDIFHTNTFKVFDGTLESKNEIYKKGNYLISICALQTIAIVDPEKEEIVWGIDGDSENLFKNEHEPILLENGNILLFDNWLGKEEINKDSRVIEIDPFTHEIVWEYGHDQDSAFYSECCGTNQMLPNGNILIAETSAGRAIEVTRDKEIVWEYYNPNLVGDNDDYIASIFQMHRIEKEDVKWLEDLKKAGSVGIIDRIFGYLSSIMTFLGF